MKLAEAGLAGATGGLEGFDRTRVLRRGDHPVGDPARELRTRQTRDREHDRRRRDRPREQLGVFDAVVRSRVVHVVAVQEGTDDLDGLFEHGAPFGRAGPSLPRDMLAEPLSAADPRKARGAYSASHATSTAEHHDR